VQLADDVISVRSSSVCCMGYISLLSWFLS